MLYGIYFEKATGNIPEGWGYVLKQPEFTDVYPEEWSFKVFDDSHPNYETLYKIAVHDADGTANQYLMLSHGGITFDFENNDFVVHARPAFDKVGAIRDIRNTLIAQTDKYLMVSDLPASLKDAAKVYRQALRDLPSAIADDLTYEQCLELIPEKPGFLA